jgi:hypothetical protein
METKPRWKKAERIDREYGFELEAEAREIFPLLCPVREYDWIPDWACDMVYSASGIAEKDAIFHTRMFGRSVVWTCIAYEPPRLVEYLLVLGKGGVVRLSIRLDEAGGKTMVRWAMRFTLTGLMARLADKVASREGYDAMILSRQRLLEAYFGKAARAKGAPR